MSRKKDAPDHRSPKKRGRGAPSGRRKEYSSRSPYGHGEGGDAGRISRTQVLQALAEHFDGRASFRDLAVWLRANNPEEQQSLKRAVGGLLAKGALSEKGRWLHLSADVDVTAESGRHAGHVRDSQGKIDPYARSRGAEQAGGRPPLRAKGHLAGRTGGRGKTVIGRVSAHPDGFGFVAVEGREKDVFLPFDEMRDLMHGDKVEVRLTNKRGRESGELVRIVEEAFNELVGEFKIIGGVGMVEPRSRKITQNILIHSRVAKGAHHGDWVRVRIERGSSPLRGEVLEVLEDVFKPASLIELIIAEQQLPHEFPDEVLAEAATMPDAVRESDKQGRMDLTHLPFVTIDGEDARDFDDAICVLPRGEGFEAWVAIADVAQYVKPGTAMDAEALQRSNSFYFPDRVLPMLPEKLSNGLCSLNPKVDRLAMVVRMRFDASGKRRAIHAYEAVIFSQARLTYTQVAAHYDGDKKAITDAKVCAMLADAKRLYQRLLIGREKRGALDLDMPEVKALIENEEVTQMLVRERNDAHRLIEEMMLAANTAVAEYMEQHKTAVLYRVHPAPKEESIEALNEYLAPFGMLIHTRGGQVWPLDVQHVLEKVAGKPMAHVLHRLVLRSMQQARYTPENDGHFGLAYQSYCHFTSPIRRYADLTVHRRLKALLRKENPDKVQPSKGLVGVGEQTSQQERKQQRAEWDCESMLSALYHRKDVGKTMPALISGVSKRRVFVELQPTTAEGSLAVDDLVGSYELNERMHRLVSKRGGKVYALGDTLNVVIESVDPVRGMINVSLAPEVAEVKES